MVCKNFGKTTLMRAISNEQVESKERPIKNCFC